MLKVLRGLTTTMRVYLVAIGVITLAGLIDWILPYVGRPDAMIHLVVAGLAGFGAVLIILASILGEPIHLPYSTVGFLTLFVLKHLAVVFNWQEVISGPWDTWPAYAYIAACAIPVGIFADFMIWAGKPRRAPVDEGVSPTALRQGKQDEEHSESAGPSRG